MLCEKCGKYIATTHIKTIANGIIIEQNLCNRCAGEQGLDVTPQNSLSDMLASMFGEYSPIKTEQKNKCSICGATFSDISNSGKAGCSECYKTFKAELLPYLKRVHGSTKHIGKVPNDIPSDELTKLKAELCNLVADENYEQAAVIRDRIKELETSGNG